MANMLACIELNDNNNISWGMQEGIKEHLTPEELDELRESMERSAIIMVKGIERDIKQSIAERHGVNINE